MANITSSKTRLSEYINEIGFINGIYVPWFQAKWFGSDIGTGIYSNYKQCSYSADYVKKVFSNCKAMGFDMAKIWLNENFEGMLFDENGTVVGVEPNFLHNLEDLLLIAQGLDLKMSLCLVAHNENVYSDDKSLYDKYSRYLQIAEETEHYIQNWLKPILQLVKKYPGVMLLDLYAEPEANGDLWNINRGVSWKRMVQFINRINEVVKEELPDMATTASSGCSCSTIKSGKYSDIQVDYYGADIYSNDASFVSPKDLLIDKPLMLGEYGLSNYKNATDDDQIATISKFYENCISYGVAAAFYWCYGWACNSAGEMHIVNSSGDLRKTAAYIHFLNIDRINRRTNQYKHDLPCIIVNDNINDIQWFGSRNAEKYILEINSDGVWTAIDEVPAENGGDFPDIMHYNGAEISDVEYRISAVFNDGQVLSSKPHFLK